jgi:predicted DNA-binding transcriptional regulator AlpA
LRQTDQSKIRISLHFGLPREGHLRYLAWCGPMGDRAGKNPLKAANFCRVSGPERGNPETWKATVAMGSVPHPLRCVKGLHSWMTRMSQEPKLIRRPWQYLGISRSAYYRLMAAGQAPLPVAIPGSRRCWRRADLDRLVDSLKPLPPRRRRRDDSAA